MRAAQKACPKNLDNVQDTTHEDMKYAILVQWVTDHMEYKSDTDDVLIIMISLYLPVKLTLLQVNIMNKQVPNDQPTEQQAEATKNAETDIASNNE